MNVQYMGRCGGRGGDDIHERIAPGQTWNGPYLGSYCDVEFIRQVSLYLFGDKCCVRSSPQSKECP